MIISIVLSVFGCKEEETAQGNIIGIVLDELSQQAVPEAEITISKLNLSTVTATDGSFAFSDIAPGTYNVLATKPGYTESKKAVTVFSGQTAEVSLSMTRLLPEFDPEEVIMNVNRQSTVVKINNPGDGTMTLGFTTSKPWLSVDQTSMVLGPGEEKDLGLAVDLSSLDYETYEEEVTINFDGIEMQIPVTVYHVEEANIIWQNWYLSVPIDNGSGKATSIFSDDIVNGNLTEEEKEYFHYDELDGSYVFWTKFTGYTTSGYYELNDGAYCRTELREFWQGVKDTNDNWYFNPGETHIMESTLRVDYVEGSRGRTFVGQIHGKNSTIAGIDNGPATVKVLWEKGDIEVEYYVAPANPNGEWTSDDNAKSARITVDNEKFTIKLKVEDGILYWGLVCEAKGINQDYVALYDYAGNGYHYDNYFKTGNYFQWNVDYDKSAQVRLYKVITSHY